MCLGCLFHGLTRRGYEPIAEDTRFESALEIVKKRYARGEISREEFERMKKDING